MDPEPTDVGAPTSAGLRLRYAALSDVGRVRKDNQDSGYAGPHLLVIADGVGGAARGDVASSTAVQILRRLDTPSVDGGPEAQQALAGAIHRAHDRLAELVEEDPELDGTSTTVTAALFDGARLSVGHVGDSRGYLLRGGTLSQLTKDHTFVQSLIDEGRISEAESRTHPHRNLILRAVDGVHETEPDLFDVELAPGDRVLLCSDGCSGVLDSARLADILGSGSVDYAVVELVRSALEAGSSDNVTVVVADVVDPSDPATASDPDTDASVTTGPMLVGAAAEQPRRAGTASKSFFRGHRGGDTGELEPVDGDGAAPATASDGDVDPEALRYAPQPPRHGRWLRRILVLVVLLAVLVGGGVLAWNWSQQQYYVAVDQQQVAVFRGLQADLPGVQINQVVDRTVIPIQALPAYRADQVRTGIPAEDRQDADDIVTRLTEFARVCPEPEPRPSDQPGDGSTAAPSADPSGSPAGSPTAGPSEPAGSPTGTTSPSPTTGTSPTPSETPTLAPPECIEPDTLGAAAGSGS
jgi:protein phosphatase